jgi:hypothetical protein
MNPGATEQTTNRIAIDGLCRALKPIERRETVVIRSDLPSTAESLLVN